MWLKQDLILLVYLMLENSAVATGLEKVSFYTNLKERQCQRIYEPPHNCTHLTHSSVLTWRIPGTEEPGRLPSTGSLRVGRDWSDLAAAAAAHTSKVMLKILQARLQQYVKWELPDDQAGFRKGRGTRDQIANTCCIIEKARKFQRNMYFFIDCTKALPEWITINSEAL